MGPDSQPPKTIVVYNSETGEKVCELGDITTATLELNHTEIVPEFKTDGFQLRVLPRHMSRKKFVKMLMANGISRDAANRYARVCRELRVPYGDEYWTLAVYSLLK